MRPINNKTIRKRQTKLKTNRWANLKSEPLEDRRFLTAVPFFDAVNILQPETERPNAIIASDLDGDQLDDLIISAANREIHVYSQPNGADSLLEKKEVIGDFSDLVVADLKNDGMPDLIGIKNGTPHLISNEVVGGLQPAIQITDFSVQSPSDAAPLTFADFDFDGDLDLTIATTVGNESAFFWAENQGLGQFGVPTKLINFDRDQGHATVGDFDADGDIDLVSVEWTPDETTNLVFHQNQGDAFEQKTLKTDLPIFSLLHLRTELVDEDDRPELLIAFETSPFLKTESEALEDIFPNRTFGVSQLQQITLVFGWNDQSDTLEVDDRFEMGQGATNLLFADLDNDGDKDGVRESGHTFWFEKVDDAYEPVNLRHSNPAQTVMALGQFSDTGRTDLAYIDPETDTIGRLTNTGRRASLFSNRPITSSDTAGFERVEVADLNGDDRTDIIATGSNVVWFPHSERDGFFDNAIEIWPHDVHSLMLEDVDSDGDIDFVAIADDQSVWLENLDDGSSFREHSLGDSYRAIELVDFDFDGDLDIVTAKRNDSLEIIFLENTGQAGLFAEPIILTDLHDVPELTDLLQLRLPDEDFLMYSKIEDIKVARNSDGTPNLLLHVCSFNCESQGVVELQRVAAADQIIPRVVTWNASDDTWLTMTVADVDSDSQEDVVVVMTGDFRLRSWFSLGDEIEENLLGGSIAPIGRRIVDLDLDGDADLVSTALYWFENVGEGVVNLQLREMPRPWGYDLAIADLNFDGFPDRVIVEPTRISWSANATVRFDWDSNSRIDSRDVDLLSAAIQNGSDDSRFDVDQDGRVLIDDLVGFVTEELSAPMADLNLDGKFDSSDLVRMFQVGKYETGESALWSEGDLNGDGRFDSSDLVVAFASGEFYDHFEFDDD